MERLSHTLRLSLLKIRIELARGQLKQSKLQMESLQEQLNKSLAEEARKVRQATEKAMQGTLKEYLLLHHPSLGWY